MFFECIQVNRTLNHQTFKLCSLYSLVLFLLSSIGIFAQPINRNNIKTIEIHRVDHINPGLSGDVNPEKSNLG